MNRILIVIIILLGITLFIVGTKYLSSRANWQKYALQMQGKVMQLPNAGAAEDAAIIGSTVTTVSSKNGGPLYLDSHDLESYISMISTQTGRDLVVMDIKKTILADTIPANIGKKYAEDKNSQVDLTIQDGQARSFTEISTDYPQGIPETVVEMKDSVNGSIIGAVIMSSSNIFK